MLNSKSILNERKKLEKKLKQLDKKEAKAIEKTLAKLHKELAVLRGKYGDKEVMLAIKGSIKGAKIKKLDGKRRKRAIITDETRESVKKMNEAGKTNNEISNEIGISVPTVQNIKKELGLVKTRK
jgi:hypothetical protein